ncbi:MAG TPA: biotin/lipoyl-containing protein, partial [Burkholderiaceae bacterium]|nr:biotin/lipoyl-containing protein [Burkholderiaceae bacterium]
PSPAVDESLRERMGAVAVAAARSIRYEGAGTIEFLLDRDGAFHFLEMNTRLQVEHAVTEAVYGVDLVAWQLRIAAGEPLDLQQSALRPRGHAIEARLCAEDPRHEFVPQAGTMLQWAPPSGLRVEHALEPGASVPPFYDPMIAKLIAWGADRDEARRRLERGLETTVALGVVTNRDFLRRCVSHPAFAAGQATTGFVATHLPALTAPDPPAHRKLLALAALLLRSEPSAADARSTAGAAASALRPRLALRAVLRHDGCDRTVAIAAVDADPNRCLRVTVEGVEHRMRLVELDPTWVRFACDGLVQQAGWARDGARIWLSCDGTTCEIEDRTLAPAAPQQRTGAGDGMLRAAMTGRVVAVFAAPGDRIEAGQPLVSLEAMKMEHLQCAPVAGTLKSLHATPGAQIAAGTLLAQIDPVRLDR